MALLLGYQWLAFGVPWYPAQRYMPATEFSVRGWHGMTLPSVDLLWRNLFDPRYGLFAFSPMLLAALAAPLVRRRPDEVGREELTVALLAVAGLWLFNSANQFATLQWNTGVRYMVPAVPLLFVVLVPVLRAAPRALVATLVGSSLLISVATTMMREDVVTSLRLLVATGPTLPILLVLQKTAAAYAPFLASGVQPWGDAGRVAAGRAVGDHLARAPARCRYLMLNRCATPRRRPEGNAMFRAPVERCAPEWPVPVAAAAAVLMLLGCSGTTVDQVPSPPPTSPPPPPPPAPPPPPPPAA